MADEEHENAGGEEEEVEEWTELVELEGLEDGATTIFVGGFSAVTTVDDALTKVKQPSDRIVVLPGTYPGIIDVDVTKFRFLHLSGPGVKIEGKLILSYTPPKPGEQMQPVVDEEPKGESKKGEDGEEGANEGEAEESGAEKTVDMTVHPQKQFTMSGFHFIQGGEFLAQTHADVTECQFGTPEGTPDVKHTLVVNALSTVVVSKCKIYGTGSCGYMYPFARAKFRHCEFIGSAKPIPPPPEKKKRNYVPPPPPPPSAPAKCECGVALFCDDSSCDFVGCSFSKADIGILCTDKCKGQKFDQCQISLIATVGILLESFCHATIRKSVVKLCGRECLVIGSEAHPIVRDNTFVGDVRVKSHCTLTGVCDNILGLDGRVFEEEEVFALKGFKTVSNDPTEKPKKPKPVETE